MSKQEINILPSPTWRWLKVNDIEIELIDAIGSFEELKLTKDEGGKAKLYKYKHSATARDCLDIKMSEYAKDKIIIDHVSTGSGICAGFTLNAELKKGSELTIIEVVRIEDADSLVSGIITKELEDAKLNVIQVFLSGKEVYTNIVTDLMGNGSDFNLKSAYRLNNQNLLDINYVINHIGERTNCNLDTKGVLYKGAKKTYRGTIDFKKGCKKAKGNEIEDVLLMDEDVVNKTVPVILCAEEDVEGNHGATIGRINEDILFYLQSRGIQKEIAYTLLANARIEAVINKIEQDELKEELLKCL